MSLPAPTSMRTRVTNTRIVTLALQKVGQAFCRHAYVLVQYRDRLFLRCDVCGRESQGFVLEPRKERRS